MRTCSLVKIMPLLSIIVPCYNEEAALPQLFRRLGEALGRCTFDCEVVLSEFTVKSPIFAHAMAHLRGIKDNRKQLWTLFIFQLWYHTYCSSSPLGHAPSAKTNFGRPIRWCCDVVFIPWAS
jgi:hypothetical protein